MSTVTPTGSPSPAPASVVEDQPKVIDVVGRKAPVTFTIVLLILGAALLLTSGTGDTTFRFASSTDFAKIPNLTVPAMPTAWVLFALAVVAAAESWRRYARNRHTPIWLGVAFAVLSLALFLTWAAAGETLPVVGLFSGTVLLAVPLIFGALGGTLGERVGVVNIAIEGQLLAGAFSAAVVGTLFGSAWAGVAGAALAGALVGLVLGVFAISYFVEQVIVGVVLNVLVVGVTSFMFGQIMSDHPETFNSPPRLSPVPIPVLHEIPILGPVLFKQSPLVYLLYVIVAAVTFALFRTKWGLRVRAVGEHPKAADTVGIKVLATRYRTVLLAGAIAGAGGAFYSLVAVQGFNREMTGGAGYIALAAVIFGKWHPIKATLAALLFGFVSNLQGTLSTIGAPVPSEFMLMAPYVVTLLAVAGFVGHSRGPAAAGIPYRKG